MNKTQQPQELTDFIHNLRAALPYLEKFNNQIFVIKLSGYTLQQPDLLSILDDIILLRRVGIKTIIVHGARPQIDSRLETLAMEKEAGEEYLSNRESILSMAVQTVAAVNWDLNTKLSNYGADILPISGHFIRAEKVSLPGSKEFSYTGQVKDIDVKALQRATEEFYLPLIPPLGIGPRGRPFILDPNQVALEIASRMHAKKLIILTSENGELSSQFGKRQLTTREMRQWLKDHPDISPSAKLQIRALIQAGERGVERCHFIDSSIDGALLAEILTSSGIGIMITDSSFQRIRSANLSDVHTIAEILEKPIKDLAVVEKSFSYLQQHIENFLVFCVDEDVVGCCELIPYEENSSIEISGLAVKESHRNRGIGKQLVEAAIEHAIKENNKLIFALTTQSAQFFKMLGFKQLRPDQLPPIKKTNYDFHDSLILGKYLL